MKAKPLLLAQTIFTMLFAAGCLNFIYHKSAEIFAKERWLLALVINMGLVTSLRFIFPLRFMRPIHKQELSWFLPGLTILVLSWLIAYISSGEERIFWEKLTLTDLYFVTLIPIFEELLFRGYISPIMQHRHGLYWGSYLSGVFFALAHSSFTISNLALPLPPLGPLLLAWICDFLFIKSKHICFSIFFHASCNASALIFQIVDPRWLDYLHPLYLGK